LEKKSTQEPLLVEVAWEVCNQVGGIYTVIRSKVPSMVEKWGNNYCTLGPYFPATAQSEFEPIEEPGNPLYEAAIALRNKGYEVHYGQWLITGRPRTVLLNVFSAYHRLGEIKYNFWEHHGISAPEGDGLFDQVIAFGELTRLYFWELVHASKGDYKLLAHFHEWMAGTAIPELRRDNAPIGTVFTTHATMLGRYLAMNDTSFYDNLPFLDWEKEAKYFNITPTVKIERAAAHGSHVFSTVSEVTAKECITLLGRKPDLIVPNGLNIERFTALHEFQNLHLKYKEKIHQFVMGHFFQSYSFDLDKTLYFFTSGRYEYKNKGYDITIESLARLNHRLKQSGSDVTVVMFFITKQPYHSINPQVLESRAQMEELRETCEAIEKQIGDRMFHAAAASNDFKLPDVSQFVDDYWRLRYRRILQSWKHKQLPKIVTHNLVNDDDIIHFLRTTQLVNNEFDRVKVVYHPDFIAPTNPLFGMEYGQFVRGCHMGVFPSYYEPWGYTPLECVARGVPAITSDLSGFGDYVLQTIPDNMERGIYVINRRGRSFHDAAEQMANYMFQYIQQNRRERITLRNKVESSSEMFDWKVLRSYYDRAHDLAQKRMDVK
jgi:glycogen synthase